MATMLMVSCRKDFWSATDFSSADEIRRVDLDTGKGTVVSQNEFLQAVQSKRLIVLVHGYNNEELDVVKSYATIDERSRRASQRAFLRLLARDLTYQAEAPTMWDVDFRTAVAQAEIEDREVNGTYYHVNFDLEAGGSVEIETSRPELIPACVALVANPADERYRDLVGSTVYTPLFDAPVPVVAHELDEREHGHRVEEVHPDDALGVLEVGADFCHRQ